MLSTKAFPRNTICKCLSVISTRFTKVAHEQRNISFEVFLGLPSQVAHQPNNKKILIKHWVTPLKKFVRQMKLPFSVHNSVVGLTLSLLWMELLYQIYKDCDLLNCFTPILILVFTNINLNHDTNMHACMYTDACMHCTHTHNLPLRIEGILRWHTISHNGIEESFSLSGIKTQNLQ